MREVIPFCIEHDPLKPDFIQECINDQVVRPYVLGPEAEKMTDEESAHVIKKQDLYYQEHWHRALLTLLRYNNPQVANSESYSVLSLTQDKSCPVFFHVDFCKPGKTTYIVEHNKQKGMSYVENFFE